MNGVTSGSEIGFATPLPVGALVRKIGAKSLARGTGNRLRVISPALGLDSAIRLVWKLETCYFGGAPLVTTDGNSKC